MGEPNHHQQPFESSLPKSSQLLVCAYDLLGAVWMPPRTPLPSTSTPNHSPYPLAHVLRAPCRTSPPTKCPTLAPLSLGMVCLPLQSPAGAPGHSLDFGGIRQRGKRVWSLCQCVVLALLRGACSPRVTPGQAGPIQAPF